VPHVDELGAVIQDRRLDGAVEELLRMAAEELVERVVSGHVERKPPAPATRAAPLLAKACDGSGERHGDRRVEMPDVDAELERVRRDHAEQLALGEPALELPPLLGGVAGSVRSDLTLAHGIVEAVPGEPVDQLGGAPRAREADRAHVRLHEVGEEGGRLAQARGTPPRVLVQKRRVAHHDLSLAPRGAVAIDELEIETGETLRELHGVRDRRGGQHEARIRAVSGRHPPQAPQHVRDVRAEYAAIDVCLVDDHEREIRQEVAPAVVVRKDADMEHVGIGQDEVRPLADRRPLALRGIAVVDRVAESGHAKLCETAPLVLCERFGRIEVEGPRPRVDGQHVQDGKVEAQ
jgi:hypothetical protein